MNHNERYNALLNNLASTVIWYEILCKVIQFVHYPEDFNAWWNIIIK